MSDGKRAVDSDKVWTTLITNLDYLSGLLTLHHSLLKSGSAYYTDPFPAEALAALERRGIPAQRIEYLLPTAGRDYSNDPRFYDCWSKLTPFSLDQYARVVQLDSDMLDGNGSELSAAAASGRTKNPSVRVFAAGHACVCNPLKKPHYPKDWTPENCAFTTQHGSPEEAQRVGPDPVTASPLGFMNGGLQVVNPSKRLFRQIVQHMEQGAMDMDFADQSLLSELYRGRWVPLPYVYNALKTLRWEGVHDEIWRDAEVKNVHYILAPKPWDEVDAEGNWTGKEESHRWWVDFNNDRKASERAIGVNDGF
uniref:Glycosyl transferase family protein n=1 Tax=Colletotrichum fructicola (strain Nara gc5) TaxID=1213859 RepID=L2FFU3_COLFN